MLEIIGCGRIGGVAWEGFQFGKSETTGTITQTMSMVSMCSHIKLVVEKEFCFNNYAAFLKCLFRLINILLGGKSLSNTTPQFTYHLRYVEDVIDPITL